MTEKIAPHWHKDANPRAEKMTVRLGERFSELCQWAASEDLSDALEIAYLILGLDQRTVGIPNLVDELSHPESREVLAFWNTNPLVHALQDFSERYRSNEVISRNFSRLSHQGSASQNKRLFGDIVNRTFLLTLITHPLAFHSNHAVFIHRRMLRIWLLIQASERLVRDGYPADSYISEAARYLILDSGDERWGLIDQLLSRTKHQLAHLDPSYERFTWALGGTADLLKQEITGKSPRRFLSAVAAIAQGLRSPIIDRSPQKHPVNSFKALNLAAPTNTRFEFEHVGYKVIQSRSQENEAAEEDENDNLAYLVDVDPSDSKAQQTLSSGSVYIQTAELAHYLPWSWERPLPPELRTINLWIHDTLTTDDASQRLGAALVWLAMRCSRSLALIEQVTVEPKATEEWSLSPDFKLLKRQSPRRGNAWRPSEEDRGHVAPFCDALTFKVPEEIRSAIATASFDLARAPRTLGELWERVSSSRLETWFNQQAQREFPRVTSGKLANVIALEVFNKSGNHNGTRLLTSHPNSALPGACSYANWDIQTIEKGLNLPFRRNAGETPITTAMGSLLAPLDSVLSAEIERANAQLKDVAGADLIAYHNSLTQYVVMALYAATGARPLKDPFESARHFNLEHAFVYINDKNDGGLHNGRLVPLPSQAVLLVSHYRNYLAKASAIVGRERPELEVQMSALAKGGEARIPFFFLLNAELTWQSVSEADALGVKLFHWTLPTNLFRHRYAQGLLRASVDPEVIDGWMGHAERGVATYSGYSARCWKADAKQYQDKTNALFDALPFQSLELPTQLPTLLCQQTNLTGDLEPRIFGQRARAQQRRHKVRKAVREAKDDIRIVLQGRRIEDLDEDDLNRLGSHMLLKENRLPHPHAALRFSVLTKLIERSENSNARLIRRRMVRLQNEQSIVSERVTAALSLQDPLQGWADQTRQSTLKAKLSKSSALCVGAALLAIEKRLCYPRLLTDIAQGQRFRLIQHNKHYFLEYSETLEQQDLAAPVQRHEVSYKVASLLAYGQGLRKQFEPDDSEIPRELVALGNLLIKSQAIPETPTLGQLFKGLSEMINQANLVQLPGMVASALSGRVPPTSPSLVDHVRILHGKIVTLPRSQSDHAIDDLSLIGVSRSRSQETDKLELQSTALAFFRTITDTLNRYTKASARDSADALETICKNQRGTVSIAILMLGQWIAHTTRKGQGRPGAKFKPYAKNTLTTYFSSCAGAFRELAYNVDLVAQDDEELTALCSDMLEYKRQNSGQTGFFGRRLKEFFRWATRYGVETPDWSELNIDDDSRQVSPGLMSESEYLACVNRLQAMPDLSPDHSLMLSFVLLLSYRFGLRANEAIGLLRKDWCQNEHHRWVLVRNNAFRELKRKTSRRAVPLLFPLSTNEQLVIDRVLARYASLAGNNPNKPLLCEPQPGGSLCLTTMASQISAALIAVIRDVTRNPGMVLHHCRHSFYNRLAPALLGIDTPLARHLSDNLDSHTIRATVLGDVNHVSRRSGMALARLMGHGTPITGLKNYNHLVTEWADALTPVKHPRARKIAGVLDLDELPSAPLERTPPKLNRLLSFPPPSLAHILKTLRLVALGQSYDRAGALTQLHPHCLANLRDVVETATANMRFKSLENKNVWLKGTECPNALLESISDQGWARLISHTEHAPALPETEQADANWPGVEELPFLTGQNRHLLMDQPPHCQLVRLVTELFNIPPEQYRVVARFDDPSVAHMLEEFDFEVSPEIAVDQSGNRKRLYFDAFPTYIVQRARRYQSLQYGGFILTRSRHGIVHDSFELAVAFLATGVLQHHSATAGNQHS